MTGRLTRKGRVFQPPAILWHGTRRRFDAFDPLYLGAAVRNPTTGIGFWFSDRAEDASYWAARPVEVQHAWHAPPGAMELLEVALAPRDYLEIDPPRFRFWLQRARTSTIQRDTGAIAAEGFGGITVRRENGARWFCAFEPADIAILSRREIALAPAATADPEPEGDELSPSGP